MILFYIIWHLRLFHDILIAKQYRKEEHLLLGHEKSYTIIW
nr:MAG TPA: hypothetical protein [Caudoviricetes sp.]